MACNIKLSNKGLLFGLVIYIGLLPIALQGYTHFLDLMDQVETCNSNFTTYKSVVLRGELDNENKEPICRQFRKTTMCLENIITELEVQDPVHMEHVKTILDDHVQGFGKLCGENPEFYRKYESHAPCYSKHSAQTSVCLETFTSTVEEWHRAQLEDEYNYEEDYGNPSICKSVETMYSCVQSVLQACSREAASLYVELCQFQVPQDLQDHCTDTKPNWSNDTSVSPRLVPATLMLLLLCILSSVVVC